MRCDARREAAEAALAQLRAGVRRVARALSSPSGAHAATTGVDFGDECAADATDAALLQARG